MSKLLTPINRPDDVDETHPSTDPREARWWWENVGESGEWEWGSVYEEGTRPEELLESPYRVLNYLIAQQLQAWGAERLAELYPKWWDGPRPSAAWEKRQRQELTRLFEALYHPAEEEDA